MSMSAYDAYMSSLRTQRSTDLPNGPSALGGTGYALGVWLGYNPTLRNGVRSWMRDLGALAPNGCKKKYFANGEYWDKPKKRGRPSKEEIEGTRKRLAKQEAELDEDFERTLGV